MHPATVNGVCQDVIDRLNNGKLKAVTGDIITAHSKKEIRGILQDSLQATLQSMDECETCAKGGLIISWICNYNNFSFEEFHYLSTDITTFPEELVKLFGRVLLDEIEIAYESWRYMWSSDEITALRCERLKNRYEHHTSLREKMINIMQDIIDGNF